MRLSDAVAETINNEMEGATATVSHGAEPAARQEWDPLADLGDAAGPDGRPVLYTCPVDITDDERRAYGLELAGTVDNIVARREEKKAAAKEFADQIDRLETRALQLSEIIESGKHPVQVDCREILHARQRMVVVVREDTGEVVTSRKARHEDMQPRLLG